VRSSLLALSFAGTAHAQPAPYRHWQTLRTAHFDVHVARGLEREGRAAAAAAERAYVALSRELTQPRGRIDLVLSDDADYSNGYASVSPTNRIVIFATPPIEHAGLRFNEDWLELVIVHELTHVFHLGPRTRRMARGADAVRPRAVAVPQRVQPVVARRGARRLRGVASHARRTAQRRAASPLRARRRHRGESCSGSTSSVSARRASRRVRVVRLRLAVRRLAGARRRRQQRAPLR
jgi:hypothetical protein